MQVAGTVTHQSFKFGESSTVTAKAAYTKNKKRYACTGSLTPPRWLSTLTIAVETRLSSH